MKLFDIKGDLVSVDVRPSTYPIKGVSKSNFQHNLGKKLQEIYPNEIILEEFTIPGCRMKLDFFSPRLKRAWESDGSQHKEFSNFYHGNKDSSTKFTKQIKNDSSKEDWCAMNNIILIRIESEDDIRKLG